MNESEVTRVSLSSGLEDSDVMAEVDQALKQRDYADYKCFQMLERLIREIPTAELAKLFAKSTLSDLEEVHEFLDECREVIQQRKDANKKFLRALAGKL